MDFFQNVDYFRVKLFKISSNVDRFGVKPEIWFHAQILLNYGLKGGEMLGQFC